MICAGRERWLVAQPRERPDQREQVGAIYVGSRHALALSVGEKPRACRAHRDARSMKRGISILDGSHHRSHNAAIITGDRDGFA